MTHYIRRGASYMPSSETALDIYKMLPPGNYVVKIDPFENFYLEQIEDFSMPEKLYGSTLKQATRILNTFNDRFGKTTGVLLSGEKGSGKSLLAKQVSIMGRELSIPTIVINSPFKGDKFNHFIQTMEQRVIILFDEFEKVYDREDQEQVLTLLDGVFPTEKLFILTVNDKWRINDHMRNRPGRIFYHLEFGGLEVEFIREYCEEKLNNKSHIDQLIKVSSLFAKFNFDSLKAMVEDMNRYNESPQEVLVMLNARPEYDGGANYTVRMFNQAGAEIPQEDLETREWSGNPLVIDYRFEYQNKSGIDSDGEWYTVKVASNNLVEVQGDRGRFMYKTVDGFAVELVKLSETKWDYFKTF